MNSTRLTLRLATFAFTGLSLSVGAGCEEESTAPPEAEVIYEAGATDEALDALLAETAQDVPAEAAHLTWPVDGEMLLPDDPLSFWFERFEEEARIGVPPSPTRHASRGFELDFGVSSRTLSPFVVPALFALPNEAFAHGTPINGRAYYLVASTKDRPNLLRVFTMDETFEPDEAAKSILTGARAPITVVVTNAVFEDNRVIEGPFEGIPITVEFLE